MDQTQLAQIEKSLEKRQTRYRNRLKRVSRTAREYLNKKGFEAEKLRDRSRSMLAGAGLVGTLVLNTMSGGTATAMPSTKTEVKQDFNTQMTQALSPIVPHYPSNLDDDTASKIEDAISNITGFKVAAELEGQKLNHQVGYVGYEQHLMRFPGDTLAMHDEELIAGIAPGKGAWGYFSPSQDEFTTEDYMREKYYSVAQTLYLPNWNTDFAFLRDWYKYRKILIVNPVNGKAVVTALSDAGPAEWTGKQFGASPEAMKALDLHEGPRKGLVVFLFVDDPENKIPLGPLTKPINI